MVFVQIWLRVTDVFLKNQMKQHIRKQRSDKLEHTFCVYKQFTENWRMTVYWRSATTNEKVYTKSNCIVGKSINM